MATKDTFMTLLENNRREENGLYFEVLSVIQGNDASGRFNSGSVADIMRVTILSDVKTNNWIQALADLEELLRTPSQNKRAGEVGRAQEISKLWADLETNSASRDSVPEKLKVVAKVWNKFSKIRDESSLTELRDMLAVTKSRVIQNKFKINELGGALDLIKSYEVTF